ncbi:hypothetical protein BC939DRAFT_8102 [Gamsiella multidivaricata]|uniref:uncharacterized protein n=1 Tax=Gamsiella multidivaricata TaxID=101098 RepID=UPI00221FC99B|nr:uncharacterized protein BC939DRAFT_8102 [Gamsiella multidivaricata]KAI7832843.1 hypothetical protein BC939DRAFT_8102 [Gamsiella multidivaricata]
MDRVLCLLVIRCCLMYLHWGIPKADKADKKIKGVVVVEKSRVGAMEQSEDTALWRPNDPIFLNVHHWSVLTGFLFYFPADLFLRANTSTQTGHQHCTQTQE